MLRFTTVVCLFAFAAPTAQADLVIYRDKGKVKITGIRPTIVIEGEKVEITPENAATYAEHSTGYIANDGFATLGIKKTARSKSGKNIPRSQVLKAIYTSEPTGLLNGYNSMATGAWGPAIASFRGVYRDKEQRSVFRLEAAFQIGMCYLSAGNLRNAVAHFKKWPSKTSKDTPEVYRLVGAILTRNQKYKSAAAWYGKIKALEGIPAAWKYRADLGVVNIALHQKAYAKAEAAAKRTADATRGKKELADGHAAALTLQSKAIVGGKNKERFAEAEGLAARATKTKGATAATLANAYTVLGDSLYAQGKLDEARYPYLRVVCLYPRHRAFVAVALENAGQIFLDLALREEAGSARRKDLLPKGMQLLSQCASKHRGTASAARAGRAYRQHKAEYEAIKAEKKGEEEG